jgi:hypothetical protein
MEASDSAPVWKFSFLLFIVPLKRALQQVIYS